MAKTVHVSNEKARDVWNFVSQHPSASMTEIAAGTGFGRATVCHALRQLADQGHIEYVPYASRARRILIPMAKLGESVRIVKRNA